MTCKLFYTMIVLLTSLALKLTCSDWLSHKLTCLDWLSHKSIFLLPHQQVYVHCRSFYMAYYLIILHYVWRMEIYYFAKYRTNNVPGSIKPGCGINHVNKGWSMVLKICDVRQEYGWVGQQSLCNRWPSSI